jgi:hypothetical protein
MTSKRLVESRPRQPKLPVALQPWFTTLYQIVLFKSQNQMFFEWKCKHPVCMRTADSRLFATISLVPRRPL